jgi:hypothetical protein
VQPLAMSAEDVAYWRETVQARGEPREAARRRVLALLHHQLHQRTSRKRPALALEIVQPLEQEGHFPRASYAVDKGLLPLELTRFIDSVGPHWVSELDSARPLHWQGQGRRVDAGAAARRHGPPERCRPVRVRGRNGDPKQ